MLLLRHRQKGSGRTVEAGHYVVLAAITSKFIWAPERKNKQKKMVEKKQRKEKRWIYAKKEAPSVWTDMTWWVHFQKPNLGLVCQNTSQCWEQLICSVEMNMKFPPEKTAKTKPIQIKVRFEMWERNSPLQISKLLLGCTFHKAARTQDLYITHLREFVLLE